MNEKTGYKIADYYEGTRNADSADWADMEEMHVHGAPASPVRHHGGPFL